jgi:glyoxylase-like metal-dependent hydrolase (beta-lactamase superfamily II)
MSPRTSREFLYHPDRVKVHHLNLCTMCPFGGRLINGDDRSILSAGEMVVHALVAETTDGLVLVDTGMGLEDVKSPTSRLGASFTSFFRPALRERETAIRQVEALGFSPTDVRHVVVTHLDLDHAGGIADFPHAKIHVHRAEHDAMRARATAKERTRYRKVHFAGNPDWAVHEADGETWLGFASVRAVADDVLMIPLPGHSRGHCAIAVRAPPESGVEWLLHCGDAYFHHGQLAAPPFCPPILDVFQRAAAVDNRARLANTARLAQLHRDHSTKVRLFSAHDAHELRAITAAAASQSRAAE